MEEDEERALEEAVRDWNAINEPSQEEDEDEEGRIDALNLPNDGRASCGTLGGRSWMPPPSPTSAQVMTLRETFSEAFHHHNNTHAAVVGREEAEEEDKLDVKNRESSTKEEEKDKMRKQFVYGLYESVRWVKVRLTTTGEEVEVFLVDRSLAHEKTGRLSSSTFDNYMKWLFQPIKCTHLIELETTRPQLRPSAKRVVWCDPRGIFKAGIPEADRSSTLAELLRLPAASLPEVRFVCADCLQDQKKERIKKQDKPNKTHRKRARQNNSSGLAVISRGASACWTDYVEYASRAERTTRKGHWFKFSLIALMKVLDYPDVRTAKEFFNNCVLAIGQGSALPMNVLYLWKTLNPYEKETLVQLVSHLGNAALYWEGNPELSRRIFELGPALSHLAGANINPTSAAYTRVVSELWLGKVTKEGIDQLTSAIFNHWYQLSNHQRADRCNQLGIALRVTGQVDQALHALLRALAASQSCYPGPNRAIQEAYIHSNLARTYLPFNHDQALNHAWTAMNIVHDDRLIPKRGLHFQEEIVYHVVTTWFIVVNRHIRHFSSPLPSADNQALQSEALYGVQKVYGQESNLVRVYSTKLSSLDDAAFRAWPSANLAQFE